MTFLSTCFLIGAIAVFIMDAKDWGANNYEEMGVKLP